LFKNTVFASQKTRFLGNVIRTINLSLKQVLFFSENYGKLINEMWEKSRTLSVKAMLPAEMVVLRVVRW
jgi:hypothetical protein